MVCLGLEPGTIGSADEFTELVSGLNALCQLEVFGRSK